MISGARPDIAALLTIAQEASLRADGTRAMTALNDAYLKAIKVKSVSIAADALYMLARQARMNNDVAASLNFASLIFELPEDEHVSVRFKAYLAIGAHQAYSGRDSEVLSTLRNAESECSAATLTEFSDYLMLRGCAVALQGRVAESTINIDLALEMSKKRDLAYSYALKTLDAAASAPNLGLTSRARSLFERVAETAAANNLGYMIPLSMLFHAWLCLLAGAFADARALFEAAEQNPSNQFWVRVCRSAVGVLLGTLTDDERITQRCLDVGALDLAFLSRTAQWIGPIAAAFHEYYFSIGDDAVASDLLSRAIRAISSPDECWWLLLQVASRGGIEDTSRALEILKPYSDGFQVAVAHRQLLAGRLAYLEGRDGDGRSCFNQAAAMFSRLGWRYHYATALSLASRDDAATAEFSRIGMHVRSNDGAGLFPFANAATPRSALTAQERDIALFVSRGATNRRIAERLGIAERSVKYHLTTIFNILGVENRAALAELVNSQPDFFLA